MSFSRSVGIVVALRCLVGISFAASTPAAQAPVRSSQAHSSEARPSKQEPALLPQQFGGWEMQGSPERSTDTAAADPTNAAVLREFRFADLASSTYTRDDGRPLKIRGA